jgi:hypothetical protein
MKRIFPRATPAQAAALDKWLTEPAEFLGKMILCDDCRLPTGANSVIVKTRLLCRECAKARVGLRKLAYQQGWRDAGKWSAENLSALRGYPSPGWERSEYDRGWRERVQAAALHEARMLRRILAEAG